MQTQTATRLGDAFLSTPSARRATVLRDTFDYDISISIHALREEGDVPPRASFSSSFYFYPRPPRGGRLNPPTQEEKAHQFLSTPSARRATTRTTYADRAQMISIHALREEGDNIGSLSPGPTQNFYPRPPRGGRPHSSTVRLSGGAFLSTPSARRATDVLLRAAAHSSISIHALREEGDTPTSTSSLGKTNFYPRPPRGGRRQLHRGRKGRQRISIHALREEGDSSSTSDRAAARNFYPRPPRGGRHDVLVEFRDGSKFLSTPSARRATWPRPTAKTEPLNFYPRPPRGGRHYGIEVKRPFVGFLSTPSARRATRLRPGWFRPVRYFYPRPPRGGRLTSMAVCAVARLFLSTPSARRATV